MDDQPASASVASAAADDASTKRYLESCAELSSAISTLESALSAFVGKDGGDVKCFVQTRARLEQELSSGGPAVTGG